MEICAMQKNRSVLHNSVPSNMLLNTIKITSCGFRFSKS